MFSLNKEKVIDVGDYLEGYRKVNHAIWLTLYSLRYIIN